MIVAPQREIETDWSFSTRGDDMGKVLSWVGAASVLIVIGILFWTSGGLTVSESKNFMESFVSTF